MKATLDWNRYLSLASDVASEGMVMLENDNALPFRKGSDIALFGRMQSHYYKSGTGSGGMVNVNHVITVREAMEKSPDLNIDKEISALYDAFELSSPPDNGIGWGNEPWSQEEMLLSDEAVSAAAERNDAAVIVIARLAGEDRDNSAERGAYYLSEKEEDMISKVCSAFDKTVVLINSGNLIDMSFVGKYKPSAVLYIWQGGMNGASAVPEVLTGNKTPSGHLTDTIAKAITDYPSDLNFGKGDGLRDDYAEDIYVGYRFFETFAKDRVLYPFGYGLTYTKFAVTSIELKDLELTFKVTNTGDLEGKYVPMVFASCPQGKLGKPLRVLCAFSKTSLLKPGESEDMKITIDPMSFASYDDSGKTESPYSWVLEEGIYEFFLGGNVRDAALCGTYEVKGLKVLEVLSSAFKPYDRFKRIIPEKTDPGFAVSYEDVPVRQSEAKDKRLEELMPEIRQTGDRGITFPDVKNGKNTLDEFIAQLDDEQLSLIVRGEGMGSPKVTTGTAGAFAGLTREMRAMGVPACCCADGPSGMRIDSGKCAMALPNGTCIASTFNTSLVEELFECTGLEMRSNEIDVLLGPGINIHRHPLNGRNFEYFSEDPYLTGRIVCAALGGLHKYKVTGCIKHFCANNREKQRHFMSSNVSERALREIYLKGFEMAVKEGGAKCVMTVYNRINGVYGSSCYDLTTKILRQQFGFKGIVMSDWWAHVGEVPYGEGNKTKHSACVRSQNDLYMCCPKVEKEEIGFTDVFEELKKGNIERAELQRIAGNVLRFALDTPAMDRVMGEETVITHVDSPFADDTVPVKTDLYFEIYDGSVADLTGFKTVEGHDAVFGLSVREIGSYEFRIYASSELSELAQIPMTCFYTSIPLKVITWNGTDGKETYQGFKVFCSGQPAIVRLHFAGPGVTLKRMEAIFICKERLENEPT